MAITILVRNPESSHDGCRILYHDIGDYLKREEKLAVLREAKSIAGISNWQTITPDRHNDWIGKRSEAFQECYPVGSKGVKAGKSEEAIFKLYSNGYKTGRDAYVYNFSQDNCAGNARKMVSDYLEALQELKTGQNPGATIDDITRRHSSSLRWDRELKRRVRQHVSTDFSEEFIREVVYRPFVKQHLYADYTFSQAPGQTRDIFPSSDTKNRAICVPGVGSNRPFSALVVDTMPDLNVEAAGGQCFPRYRFVDRSDAQGELYEKPKLERIDNITDTALSRFRLQYNDNSITKDAMFDYVYGILHAPSYRKRFANDLAKELPRVSLAKDFHAFSQAGHQLSTLHLSYETCKAYPLEVELEHGGAPQPEHFRIGTRAMRYADDEKTVLIINEHIKLKGIPVEAHRYQVNGRTPLGWFIDRYRITRDTSSGIINDPNGWFGDPQDLVTAIRRIVHVSVETMQVVEALPEPILE